MVIGDLMEGTIDMNRTGSPNQKSESNDAPEQMLTADEWQDKVKTLRSMYQLRGISGRSRMGWLNQVTLQGFAALDIGSTAPRIERTHGDIRQDPDAYYFAMIQKTGGGVITQDDKSIRLAPGDIALCYTGRPVTYDATCDHGEWISVKLPIDELQSHFGKEPKGPLLGKSSSISCSMLHRVFSTAPGSEYASADEPNLRLVVWDLFAAMFARQDVDGLTADSQELLSRTLKIIRNRCQDANLSAQDVASEIGVSLRSLQKLFASRGTTCSQAIMDARLDTAARLIERRVAYGGKQTLGEISYLCGFNDYSYFSRSFARRFRKRPSVDAR